MQNCIMRKSFKSLLFVLLLSFSFFSCDSGDPEIISANASCVFDFTDNKAQSDSYLSIFVQLDSKLQKTDSIEIDFLPKKYSWKINDPELFETDGKKWAGYRNIRFPDGVKIENGVYQITYTDLAGNEVQSSVTVSFNKKLLTAKAADSKKYLTAPVIENFCIYDESKSLLFFGKRKSSWNDDSDVVKDYKDAVYVRECFSSSGNHVQCLMPLRKIEVKK